MSDDLFALYDFNRWAHDRVIEALKKLSPEQYVQEPAPGWASVRATVVHLAGATDIWARRLQGELVTVRPTEEEFPTLDDAIGLFDRSHDALDHLLPTLTPEQLADLWNYRNLQGEPNHLPLWTVLRHVVNHGSYHRGQIASKLKLLGFAPPVIDLVYWAIERTPQG